MFMHAESLDREGTLTSDFESAKNKIKYNIYEMVTFVY